MIAFTGQTPGSTSSTKSTAWFGVMSSNLAARGPGDIFEIYGTLVGNVRKTVHNMLFYPTVMGQFHRPIGAEHSGVKLIFRRQLRL
jgi:hypothetical protein